MKLYKKFNAITCEKRSGGILTFCVCAVCLLAKLILPLEHSTLTALVETRVEGVEVLRVKVVLGDADGVAEITLLNGKYL